MKGEGMKGEVARSDDRRAFYAPNHTVRYYYKGAIPSAGSVLVGDLVLVSGSRWTDRLIQFGESLHMSRDHRQYSHVNHAATVVHVDVNAGNVVVQEMDGGGGRLRNLADYAAMKGVSFAVVSVRSATMSQRNAAVRSARWYVDVPYGWASIITDAVYCLLGIPFFLSIGQSVVCSAAATASQRCVGLIPDKPDIAVMPSDLARYYGVRLMRDRDRA